MKLTRAERWILANQYRILEALYPSDGYDKAREVLECGYELHYDWISEHIYGDRDVMTTSECEEVLAILDMFSMLEAAYEKLADRSGIEEWAVRFSGFDGNNETKQLGYARFFCSHDGGRYPELRRGDFNSHCPTLDAYRRMLVEWEKASDKLSLTKEDVVRMASARRYPGN